MLTDSDAKKLKISESESDAAGGARPASVPTALSGLPFKSPPGPRNESDLCLTSKAAGQPLQMPKVGPSEPPPSREEYAAGSAPAMPEVGPSQPPPSKEEYLAERGKAVPKTPPKAPSTAAGPAPAPFLLPESEKDFSLGDLKNVVTSLAALDACLVHFSSAASSKHSTPEGTLDPAAENAPDNQATAEDAAVSEADYGGDGDEEEMKSWEELGAKDVNASPEALKRLTDLLGQHKTNLEKLLEQQESKEKAETAAGEVFNALMRQEWDNAANLIEKLRPEQVDSMVDYSGMTILHHAVRSFHLPLVLQIVEKCPSLANRPTAPNRQPGHWTPLMIFCNLNSPARNSPRAENENHIGYLLCQHMSLDGLNVRGTTYCTATHIAVSRSKWSLVKSILYRINDLGGKAAVMFHTKMVNNSVSRQHFSVHA